MFFGFHSSIIGLLQLDRTGEEKDCLMHMLPLSPALMKAHLPTLEAVVCYGGGCDHCSLFILSPGGYEVSCAPS